MNNSSWNSSNAYQTKWIRQKSTVCLFWPESTLNSSHTSFARALNFWKSWSIGWNKGGKRWGLELFLGENREEKPFADLWYIRDDERTTKSMKRQKKLLTFSPFHRSGVDSRDIFTVFESQQNQTLTTSRGKNSLKSFQLKLSHSNFGICWWEKCTQWDDKWVKIKSTLSRFGFCSIAQT